MANEYRYGAYGDVEQTVAQSSAQGGTAPVYVGTAPINLIRGFADAGLVGMPVKLSNLTHAQKTVGYAADWSKFTLCEAIAGHFDNTKGNIGPIYVINALNPTIHKGAEATERSLTFVNGRSEFASVSIILDTFAIANKAEGVDYTLDYNFTAGTVIVSSVDADAPLTGSIDVSFFEVDTTAVEATDIIGGVTSGGVYSGLAAIKLMFPELSVVPNLIAAPGWSHIPAVYNAMITAGQKINGHWYAYVVADLPLTDSEGAAIDTIVKAKSWKADNGYTSGWSKIYWPQGIDNLGRVFHLSTMAVVEYMRADAEHNDVTMETCGNKTVPLMRQYFGDSYAGSGFDKEASLELVQDGVCTLISWGGVVLWGDHTAAYKFGAEVDARYIFDVSVRMMMFILNGFQRRHMKDIDQPMSIAKKDEIINTEQEQLDALASMGALLGQSTIYFLESENSTTDLMNGDFKWDIPVTPTPPLKSATVGVAYTDSGFAAYFEEE